MKRFISLLSVAALALAVGLLFTLPADTYAQPGKGKPADKGFVDANNDGINDNAKDADGDGIPNGQDPDYTKLNPNKGKGRMGFVDENGDGINDLARDDDGDGIPNGKDSDYVKPKDGTGRQFGKLNGGSKMMNGKRGGNGPGDGTGNKGIGPRDGSGFGPGNGTGTGVCDGTGPKGKTQQGGRR